MISHKHKFIFIHVPKCAGSSIETAFGINVNNNDINKENLFGWDDTNKIYLQHATPQELFDYNLISREQWSTYYKFIIVRNPWDKAISDFFWFKETKNFKGSFEDYLYAKNNFKRFMNKGHKSYRGDHLTPQTDYMYLHGELINYNKTIFFNKINLDEKLKELATDLGVENNYFDKKVQVGKKFKKHYSMFYTEKYKKQVFIKYKNDIDFFDFSFDDQKGWLDRLKLKINPIL